MQKVNLCDACSKEKGVQDPTGFALADLLLGIGAAEEIEKGAATQKCPVCGFTQADFKKTGRLGCPDCYLVFGEGLEPLLKSMHKGTRHVGKAPAGRQASHPAQEDVKSLQEQLNKAIQAEDFEQAAHLRDEIKRLQGKSGAGTK